MTGNNATKEKKWDIFLSHAAEDKAAVARPLAEFLRKAGVRVWLDKQELKVGDSLSEKIDEGLSQSRFGAVILSPTFLSKHWPKKELAGLRANEEEGQKVILPIWHNVDKATVIQASPILADALAANTANGIEHVAMQLLDVIFAPTSDSPSARKPSVARRLIEILESKPDKAKLIDFLRMHLRVRGRYLGWGSPWILQQYEFDGTQFDAYAPYVGHGCVLTLVSFTEAWKDPFKNGQEPETNPKICDEVASTISTIRSIQERFNTDATAQMRLRNDLIRADGGDLFVSRLTTRPDYFDGLVPNLQFFIFAGRRSSIDASTAKHDTWSRLLKQNSDIQIKSYDHLVDAFLDSVDSEGDML
jgi:hypothetical protein